MKFKLIMELNAKKGHVKFILALVLDHPSFTPVVSLQRPGGHLAVLVFISLDWAARSILTCI